ncbi:Zn(2)-C6 fungal-type domain-containing protein [Fusarium sp. Ph1]|nr:Zn(2)-C6 fungal-type domain-containing protein [Fusarium sp. Ph1]
MKTRRTRNYRRVSQACDNCRRKKIRCPGQKPRCSACTRLGQACCYADGEYSGQAAAGVETRVANRLTQLEEKLDRIISRVDPLGTQDVAPCSAPGAGSTTLASSPSSVYASPTSLLSRETITRAIEIYFTRIRRQPLWLFDTEFPPTPDSSVELICVILALSVTYDDAGFSDSGLRSPLFYGNTARRLIMLKVAEGTVDLQSVQALCLLAFFNLISGDIPLAGLNATLAKNILQYLTLGHQGQNNSSTTDEHSKLFWSINLLDACYGLPVLAPSSSADAQSPNYSTIQTWKTSVTCSPFPQQSRPEVEQTLPHIWSHSARISSLWGAVRLYISRCFEDTITAPWQPTSDYSTLCSDLLEFETSFPISLSYNLVNFPERSPQEVQDNRADWLPWLRLQVTYHAIHCVLNHPFLYSPESSKQRLGSNTFWRGSFEKALRHCTWISRLIRVANEKGLDLADPFFAQAAAIAGTLHLYWTRSNDDALKNSATGNLEICQGLIVQMAAHWPLCVTMSRALEHFIDLVSASNGKEAETTPVAAKKSLMWMIMDIAAPQFPAYPGEASNDKDLCETGFNDDEYRATNESEIRSSPTDMRESTAHYASPPEWLPSRSDGPSTEQRTKESLQEQRHVVPSGSIEEIGFDRNSLDLLWGPWEQMMRMSTNPITDLDWWDMSNL